jgi:hypothetical protein
MSVHSGTQEEAPGRRHSDCDGFPAPSADCSTINIQKFCVSDNAAPGSVAKAVRVPLADRTLYPLDGVTMDQRRSIKVLVTP